MNKPGYTDRPLWLKGYLSKVADKPFDYALAEQGKEYELGRFDATEGLAQHGNDQAKLLPPRHFHSFYTKERRIEEHELGITLYKAVYLLLERFPYLNDQQILNHVLIIKSKFYADRDHICPRALPSPEPDSPNE